LSRDAKNLQAAKPACRGFGADKAMPVSVTAVRTPGAVRDLPRSDE
jgi:hypothetical protein